MNIKLLFVVVLAGCAAPAAKETAEVAPVFPDEMLANVPGVKQVMDRCKALGKVHETKTSMFDNGHGAKAVRIKVSCPGTEEVFEMGGSPL